MVKATKLQGLTFSGIVLTADASHPNKMKFSGVLVRLDEPSNKPPNGSQGHKILVPSDVARDRLDTLKGMGLNYSPTLDGHAQKRKVGVIQKAWIEGKNLCVSGHIWKHDFPEAKKDLKQDGLGMSMEIGDVFVEDQDAPIWKLTDFCFLGATILYKDAAAYHNTQAIAASKERRTDVKKPPAKKSGKEKDEEGQTLDAQQIATIAATAVADTVADKVTQRFEKKFGGMIRSQTDILAQLSGRLTTLELNAKTGDDEEEADDEEANMGMVDQMTTKPKVSAKAKDDEDDEEEDEEASVEAKKAKDDEEDEDDGEEEDDMESMGGEIDKGDLEDLNEDKDEDDDDPGHMNKSAKNKGNKTSSEDALGPNINKAVTGAALKAMQAQMRKLLKLVKAERAEKLELKKQLKRVNSQVMNASKEINRRSAGPEALGLLAKAGFNVDEMRASGTKLTAEQMDGVFQNMANAGVVVDNVKRIAIKTELCRAGMMDEGRVDRQFSLTAGR